MTPKQIERAYKGRIKKILKSIGKELATSGYVCGKPEDQSDENPCWALFVQNEQEAKGDDGEGVDIRFEILISEDTDGKPNGVAFSIGITSTQGNIIGGMTPGNYSKDLWVDRKDTDAIEARFELFEQADSGEIVYLLDKFHNRTV